MKITVKFRSGIFCFDKYGHILAKTQIFNHDGENLLFPEKGKEWEEYEEPASKPKKEEPIKWIPYKEGSKPNGEFIGAVITRSSGMYNEYDIEIIWNLERTRDPMTPDGYEAKMIIQDKEGNRWPEKAENNILFWIDKKTIQDSIPF